ncbi:MAG: putative glycoside hydrolase [Actinomycetota bacterium]
MPRLHGRGLDIFEGTGGVGRRRRGPGDVTLIVSIVVVLALAGAAGWALFRHLNPDNTVPLVVLGVEGPDGQLLKLGDAVVTGPDGKTATTGEDGTAALAFTAPADLTVTAAGYQDAMFRVEAVPPDGPLGLQLEPLVLKGRVTDSHGTRIIGASVQLGAQEATTDEMGSFELVAAVPGPVQVSKMAFATAEADWDGSAERFVVTLEPFIVKGIRVHGPTAGTENGFSNLLEMIDGTVINTLVFDTKDEKGRVSYESQVADARDTGALVYDFDVATVLAAAEERGYYTITRIVTFQDPFWAPANPDHAARNTATGGVWTTHTGLAWADPTDREAWEYPLALAVEACRLGFDEIQFDYVRFPTDGDTSVIEYDGPANEEARVETVAAFLAEARERLHAEGCVVSADVFAIILSAPNDQGIGQRVEEVSASVDALSPMIYPSHYSSGWLGFDNPNAHPGEVVGQALDSGLPRMQGALLRPWLQAFYYDADQIAEEIRQAEENGLGWMLWNQTSAFEADWFPTE